MAHATDSSRTPCARALNHSSARPHAAAQDVLVVGLGDSGIAAQHTGLRKADITGLTRAAQAIGFTGDAEHTATVPAPAGFKATAVLLVGLGDFTPALLADPETADAAREALRLAAGTALRAVKRTRSVAVALPVPDTQAAEAVATAALLGSYAFTDYKSTQAARDEPVAEDVTVLSPKNTAGGIQRARAVAAAVNRARDLVNTPPRDLYPESFARLVTTQAKERKVKVTVLDDKELAAQGFGGITGVGQGSPRGPRLVKLEYAPRKAERHLALVGKGITFDSGGLSLKPPASMEDMKSDMAGAAAVGQALFAVAELRLPVRVTAWLALAENLPGGNAQRPSDVLHMYGGKTVEVTNTDAEGRLVLADALVAAGQDAPDLIVDVATLTGAQMVALGMRTAGVMGTSGARNRVVVAGQAAGESVWPMPLPPELRKGLDSSTADLKNAGPRPGGMLLAATFLQEFVAESQAWAHVDVAGPAFNNAAPWGYTLKEGTGVPVRTLVELAAGLAES